MTSGSAYHTSTPGHLTIGSELDAQGIIVALTGELDLASAPELDRHLQELECTHPGRLLIDLSGLDFMDSTGIALLIRAERSADSNGHRLTLRRGPAQIQRLFELTGVLALFTFEG